MLIRPYEDRDHAGVQGVLDHSWPDDPVMRELHTLHGPAQLSPWQQTLKRTGWWWARGRCDMVRDTPRGTG